MEYVIKTAIFITLILTLFCLSFSCSDDTIDEINVDFKTFLEENDGTEWLLSKDDIKVYIRLNNDSIQLIEQWRFNSELNCYAYNSNIFSPGSYTIKENSKNKLVIDCDPILGDCDCMTFSRLGNTLTVDIKISEWEEETVFFNISSVKVDELLKCDAEGENSNLKFYN